MALVGVSLYLLARRPKMPWPWLVTTFWGLFCILLSGRRKMLFMSIIFAGIFVLATQGTRRLKLVISLGAILLVIVPLLVSLIDERYLATAESTLPATGDRILHQTVAGPLWLFPEIGVFGFGVGTRTQGTQHLDIETDVPLTEGGLEKILVELGIFGTLAFLLGFLVLIRCAVQCYRQAAAAGMFDLTRAALLAFLVANFAGFTTAFQIFGDPLVVVLVGFSLGLLLSVPRLAYERRAAPRLRYDELKEASEEQLGSPIRADSLPGKPHMQPERQAPVKKPAVGV
jgi:O-antigen ligase